MIALNLEAKTQEQIILKNYLEENVSKILAEKINNGIRFAKDGIPLVGKKNLDGFMKYACDEAKKLTEKGANSACVEDKTVFGWAIHYFEEDTIEGTLYNIDGTEFKPIKPKYEPKATTAPIVPSAPKPKPQLSFFDLGMGDERKKPDEPEDESDEISEVEQQEILRELAEEEAKQNESDEAVDCETGEILTEKEMRKFDGDVEEPKELLNNSINIKPAATVTNTAVDNKIFNKLSELLGNIIITR